MDFCPYIPGLEEEKAKQNKAFVVTYTGSFLEGRREGEHVWGALKHPGRHSQTLRQSGLACFCTGVIIYILGMASRPGRLDRHKTSTFHTWLMQNEDLTQRKFPLHRENGAQPDCHNARCSAITKLMNLVVVHTKVSV